MHSNCKLRLPKVGRLIALLGIAGKRDLQELGLVTELCKESIKVIVRQEKAIHMSGAPWTLEVISDDIVHARCVPCSYAYHSHIST